MYRIGVDVGGTFTDCICLLPQGSTITAKVPTTPADPSDGVFAGIEALAARVGLSTEDFLTHTSRFVHGTTVATNALVERRGTPTAILTSRGHEDTLVVGKVYQKRAGLSEREMVHMAQLELADPLVTRDRVWGVAERMDYRGRAICALDEDGVRAAGEAMVAAGVRAVAVCFLWSFINPDHEQRAAAILRSVDPDLFVVCSHDVAPVLGEYERLTTTVLSAYLGPPVESYLARLENRLRDGGFQYSLLVMQASGGLGPATEGRRRPVTVLDSGPVGGILGAMFLGDALGRDKLVCTDVGGTTFDVGIVDGGRPVVENAPIVDKYQFRATKVQVKSIGSGGGSVAWVDETGVLKVGPRSAGAVPGPACYGRGGAEATVTDADLVLGYLDEDHFLGGEMRLDRAAAERALDALAEQLGITRMEVADGIRRILDSQMADLVRRTTIERGYDPREFTLLAYGGMGPTHAARFAADLGVREVVIPADATAFSALGMLAAARLRVYERSAPLRSPFGEDDAATITTVFDELEAQALEDFRLDGVDAADVEVRRLVLVRFQMQVHELEIEVGAGAIGMDDLDALERDFVDAYVARYGEGSAYTAAGLELVSYRIEASAGRESIELRRDGEHVMPQARVVRPVWFAEAGGFVDTSIYPGDDLPAGAEIPGPAVLERMGDTVVLPPGTTASVDPLGNLQLTLGAPAVAHDPDGEVDAITYEVIRNRLWAINDEQAMTAAQISGTPLIYEAFDFNSGILDARGRGVFAGVYVTYHTTGLDLAVNGVIRTFGDRGEIHEGDMFITNDPWVGAIHPSDVVVIAPVHHDGEIVAWTSIVMHDPDVGGPVPGSFAVGATDIFGECPIYPPLRLMEGGRYCQDIEDLFLRNSRTPALNALNLRARVACQSVANARLTELIEQFGIGTLTQVFDRIQREVHTVVSRRLEEIPDGTWYEHSYLDHDGNDNILYEAKLALTKRGSKLTFDFTGTSPQAPGMINGTVSALRGGIMAAILPILCYDVPWATGGLEQIVEIIAEPGTLNNASHPAGLTGGSIFGEAITENLVCSCVAKMLACSEACRADLMATWYPYANVQIIAGKDQFGREMAAVLLDCAAGGAGARSFADGIDCGGYLESVSIAMPNVESNERHYPILEVYRQRRADTNGHGRFRGGVGMEVMVITHDSPEPLQDIIAAAGVSQPEAPGVFGALPASVQGNRVLRESTVRRLLESGVIPMGMDEIESASIDMLAAKDRTELAPTDAHIAWYSGGGAYGDPLEREPATVQRDVRDRLCSPHAARDIYGVVLADGAVDGDATVAARDDARRARLAAARPVSELVAEVGLT